MASLIECNWLLLGLISLLTVLNVVLKWVSVPLARLIVAVMNPEPKEMSVLRKEVEGATTTLHSINQMDEFAKHARAQRSLNQQKKELDEMENSQKLVLSTAITTAQWVSTLLILIGRLVIVAKYRSVPVVTVAPSTLWPLAGLLSFPTGIPGGIGVPCWSVMCVLALNSLLDFLHLRSKLSATFSS